MDINLEVGTGTGDYIKGLRDIRAELGSIRDENLKLNQEIKAGVSEAATAEARLVNAFVGTANELKTQKKLVEDLRKAQTTDSSRIQMSAAEFQAALKASGKTVQQFINDLGSVDNTTKKFAVSMRESGKAVSGVLIAQGQYKAVLTDVAKASNATLVSTESLRAEKRRLQQEIARLIQVGEQESEMFQKLVARAGEIDDAMRDASDAIKRTGSDTRTLDTTIQVVGGLTGVFTAGTSAMALFGENSENVQRTLLKVNAAMGIAQGLQQVQNVLTNEFVKAKVTEVVLRLRNNTQIAIENGLNSQSVVTRLAAAGAQRVLNLVMAANPVAAVIVVVTAAVAVMKLYADSVNSAARAQSALNSAIASATSGLEAEFAGMDRIHKVNQARLAAEGAQQSELLTDEQNFQRLKAQGLERERDRLLAVMALYKKNTEERNKAEKTLADLNTKILDANAEGQARQFEIQKARQDEQKEAAKKSADEAKKLHDQELAHQKERLASQLETNKKLEEANQAFREAINAGAKDGLDKEREAIRINYAQRIDGIRQSMAAEQARLELGKNMTQQEKDAIVKANKVRQDTIKQLQQNEQKELATATEKYNAEATAREIEFNRTLLELQQDSVDKSIELVKLEAQERLAATRAAYKDFPAELAVLETAIQAERDRKIKAIRTQAALDSLKQQQESADRSIDLIETTGAGEAEATRAKESLKLAVAKEFADKQLDLIRKQFGLEGALTDEAIAKYRQYLATVAGTGQAPVGLLEFLNIAQNLTPEERAKIEEAVRARIQAINDIAKTQAKAFDAEGNFSLSGFLGELLGLDSLQAKQIEKAFGVIKQAIHEMTAAMEADVNKQIDLVDKRIDKIDEQVDAQQQAVDREKRLAQAGYANNLGLEQQRLEALKKSKDEEVRTKQDLQRRLNEIRKAEALARSAEITGNLIQTEVTLIAAAAKAFSAHAGIPFAGVVLGAAAAAALVAGFFAIKNTLKAAQNTPSYRRGGEADLMDLLDGRPSHENRGVGVYDEATGRRIAEFEGNEKLFVVNKGSGKKHYSLLQAINDGSIDDWSGADFERTIRPATFRVRDSVAPAIIRTERHVRIQEGSTRTGEHPDSIKYLRRIAASNEELAERERNRLERYEDENGDIIEKRGNHTRCIKKQRP